MADHLNCCSEIVQKEVASLRHEWRNWRQTYDENQIEAKRESKEEKEKIETRLRSIEDWRLALNVKLTIYSSLAIFGGTIIGTILSAIFQHYIFKN